MKRRIYGLAALVAGLFLLAAPEMASADEIVSCSSGGYSRKHCAADTSDGVQLYRQKSSAACTYGQSWGYDDDGIWVEAGCRADFMLGGGYEGDYSGGYDNGGAYDNGDYDANDGGYWGDTGNSGGEDALGAIIALGVIAAILSADQTDDRDEGYGRSDAVKACANRTYDEVKDDGARNVNVDRVKSVSPLGRRDFRVKLEVSARFRKHREREFDVECTVKNGRVTSFRYS